MIGSCERRLPGLFIYKSLGRYTFYNPQGMTLLFSIPYREIETTQGFRIIPNIWQQPGQLRLWLLALGVNAA